MAAQAIKSAIPSHLKPGNGDAEAEFANKHHGKTRSHMVSPPENPLHLPCIIFSPSQVLVCCICNRRVALLRMSCLSICLSVRPMQQNVARRLPDQAFCARPPIARPVSDLDRLR